jgi:hypothetical protein
MRVADEALDDVIRVIEQKRPGLVALQADSLNAHRAWESYTQHLAQQGKHGWEWTPKETERGQTLFDEAIAATAEKETALRDTLSQHPELKDQFGHHVISQALKTAARDSAGTA